MRLQLVPNHPTPSREEGRPTYFDSFHFKPITNYLVSFPLKRNYFVSLIDYVLLLISVAASVGFFLKPNPTLGKGHWIYYTTNNAWWDECGCSVELRYILILDRSDDVVVLVELLFLFKIKSGSIDFLTCLTTCIYMRAEWNKKHVPLGKGFSFHISQHYKGKVIIKWVHLHLFSKDNHYKPSNSNSNLTFTSLSIFLFSDM